MGITSRDSLFQRRHLDQGWSPDINEHYTIGVTGMEDLSFFTLDMGKHRALLLEFKPINNSAGVLMLASEASSPKALKAVWSNDDFSEPVRIWTDNFWKSDMQCFSTGCPRLRFVATKGQFDVRILDLRK
jgi:hypothetical protein